MSTKHRKKDGTGTSFSKVHYSMYLYIASSHLLHSESKSIFTYIYTCLFQGEVLKNKKGWLFVLIKYRDLSRKKVGKGYNILLNLIK